MGLFGFYAAISKERERNIYFYFSGEHKERREMHQSGLWIVKEGTTRYKVLISRVPGWLAGEINTNLSWPGPVQL